MASPPAFDYRRLSVAERLQLVEDIWDSIAEDAGLEGLPVSEDHKVLLAQRLADLAASPDAGAPWPEVRARIIDQREQGV